MKAILRFCLPALLISLFLNFSSAQAHKIFKAHLSGQSEVFPIATIATGEINATLSGQKLTVWGSFSGLTGELATNILGGVHIHVGMAGQNGPVIIPLRVTLNTDRRSGTIEARKNLHTLTIQQVEFLLKRQLYVNIHSTFYTDGELRGQLLPLADEYFHANLFGSQEVPAVMSGAAGAIDIELRGNEITVSGSFSGLEEDFASHISGGAHIHTGLVGENGPVMLALTTNLNDDNRSGIFAPTKNVFVLSNSQLDELRARQTYVNIHSNQFTSGEIRGQIMGQARAVLRAHLSGVNEVPNIVSSAKGVVMAEVIDESNVLFTGTFSGLEGDLDPQISGGIHIHRGLAGMNGTVEQPLNAQLNQDNRSGIFTEANSRLTLNANQMNNLIGRGAYINIHSENHPSGELRGQLLPESALYFTAHLGGSQESPSVPGGASGMIKAELSGNKLILSGSFAGLESGFNFNASGGSHIHRGLAGQNGDIVNGITPTLQVGGRDARFNFSNNTFTLTNDDVAKLRERGLYVNIHTIDAPSGEIRGQLLFEAENYFFAMLSGESENPPVNTPAAGVVAVEVTGEKATTSGSFQGLLSNFNANIGGGAHIHEGIAGLNGNVIFPLNAAPDADLRGGKFAAADNTFLVTPNQLGFMKGRMHYVNIHTADNIAGEIRGQLLPPASAYFTTRMGGNNEVPHVTSTGEGALKLELRGDNLIVTGSFQSLAHAFDETVAGGSHLHMARIGMNGGIALGLHPALDADEKGGMFLADNNSFVIDNALKASLKSGEIYSNIHTTGFAGGEIRGQVLPDRNFFPSDEATVISPADGSELTVSGAADTPFDVTWSAAQDANELNYVWQLATNDDFSGLLFETYTGSSTSFSTDYETIDALLEMAGTAVGEMTTLYHRAIASDGSIRNPSPAATIVMTRGVVIGSRPELRNSSESLAATAKVKVFPNPASTEVNLLLESESEREVSFRVADLSGRIFVERRAILAKGQNIFSEKIAHWQDGVYILLISDGKTFGESRKIIKTSGFR